MDIKKLTQKEYSRGRDKEIYYQDRITVSAGIDNLSDAYFVFTNENLKVQITNAYLYESLDDAELIEADTATWEEIATPTDTTFVLSAGISYLYIKNSSDTEEATMTVTGI